MISSSQQGGRGTSSERPALLWVTEAAPSVVHEVGLVQLRALSLNVAASLQALGAKPGEWSECTSGGMYGWAAHQGKDGGCALLYQLIHGMPISFPSPEKMVVL